MKAAKRAVLIALLWVTLTEGDPGALAFGVPVVIAAALTSRVLSPGTAGLSWRGMAQFVPFFLAQSFWGSVDVAMRALSPRLAVEPRLQEFPLRLPEGAPRVFFANTVSLVPGTVSVALQGDRLLVHVLAGADAVARRLHKVEAKVAALFGLVLPSE